VFKIVTSNTRLLRMVGRSRVLSRVIRGDVRVVPLTEDRGLADRIVSSVWVDRVALSKETVAGRFRDLDAILVELTRALSSPVIHDVGVSNGITSLDLLERFRAHGLSPRMYISDKYARCRYVQRGPVTRVYDSYGRLLHGHVGVLFADPQASWRFALSRLLFVLLDRTTPRLSGPDVTEILLYDRGVRDALEAGALTHLDYDVFSSDVDITFDVVRCMNTITRKYFSAEAIARAVANLGRSLKPSALLLVGRTFPDGRNDATFFRLLDGRFVVERVVNQGADIQEIVTGVVIRSE
jgi:hypothetical protein